MNKIQYLVPLLLACQYPDANNPDPIYDVDQSVSGTSDIVDAGQETSIDSVDVTSDTPLAKDATEPTHQNILLIGDSEVLYSSWYFKPLRRPNETVYFDSQPGTTIGWWNDGHFQREMSKYRNIDVVIVFLGTNNFNFTYLQPLQNILDTLKASPAKCIWVGPTNVRMKNWTNPHITNKLLKEAVPETCTYIDTESLDIALADGVHPSQEGAVKWLTEIWKVKDGD